MKATTGNLLSQISKEGVKELTTLVKETLDFGYQKQPTKTFSAAQLWDIQRRGRQAGSRRGFSF